MWRRYFEWKSAHWQQYFSYRLYFYLTLIWSNNLPIPVSSAMGYVFVILVCPSFSSRYSVSHPLQFPLFFNLSNISMPFYALLYPWVRFLCFHSFCLWNTYSGIKFNFGLCRLTARSHITQSSINPRFLNDRLQWYTLSPGSDVVGGSATGSVSRDGFSHRRNVKMGKVVPETCFKGGKNIVCTYDVSSKEIWNLTRKWQFKEEVLPLEL